MKKRLLITGVSGLLGSNLAYALRDKYSILGLYHTHEFAMKGIQVQEADILSSNSIKNVFSQFTPEVVIHCAAAANVDYCEDHRDVANQVNVIGTRVIVDCLKGVKAKFVYISTDSVYDGIKGNFSEDDLVLPLNYYGMTKYGGEQEALKCADALIARTNIIGWNVCDKLNLAEWILDALMHYKQIGGVTDVWFSPIYTFELAKLLDMSIARDLNGVYNIAGSGFMTKYDFACSLAQRFNLDGSLIRPVSVSECVFKAKRGHNLSLNTEKLAKDIGIPIPVVEKMIDLFYQDYNSGILEKLGSVNRLARERS